MDAHEIALDSRKPLIFLTFLPWHLFRKHNTKRRHPLGCLLVLVADMRSVLHDLRVIPTSVARWELRPAAAGGRRRQDAISAAVEEIERQRSENFFGNRKAARIDGRITCNPSQND